MTRLLHTITVMGLVTLMAASVLAAGPLPAPELEPGKHVYTIPEGWSPPGIGAGGIARLNQALSQLRHPLKVVLVQLIPALTTEQYKDALKSGLGGDALPVEYTAINFIEEWSAAQPADSARSQFDVATHSIFVLSFAPRKFTWSPGVRWRTELGVKPGPRQRRFVRHFITSVKRTPKDPVGGIWRMARAFDEYVFDRTDPARIVARARQALAGNIEWLETLLLRKTSSADAVMAEIVVAVPNRAHYEQLVAESKAVMDSTDPEKLIEQNKLLKNELMKLRNEMAGLRAKAQKKLQSLIYWRIGQGFALLFLLFLIYRLFRRWGELRQLRANLQAAVDDWNSRIRNAHERWLEHYLDRGIVMTLDDVEGESAECYKTVTTLVDEIYIAIQAMESHLASCLAMAEKAHVLNFGPVKAAEEAMESKTEADQLRRAVESQVDAATTAPTQDFPLMLAAGIEAAKEELREEFKDMANQAARQEMREELTDIATQASKEASKEFHLGPPLIKTTPLLMQPSGYLF